MPNLDHKGPEDLGPKTGKKLGTCRKTKSDTIEDSANEPCGTGRGKGTGRRKGIGRRKGKGEKCNHR